MNDGQLAILIVWLCVLAAVLILVIGFARSRD